MPEEDGGQPSRYETLFRLASGGMATVYVGTVRGAFGFRQLVAIKKPHAHLVADSEFRKALIREARLASLIHHANVVDVRDVEATDKEVSLVMDYVEGASLSELLQAAANEGRTLPAGVAVRIVLDACAGLHAAHEQTDERGRPLGLIHRDISPQNLLVGVDGLTRVADFGVAKFKRTEAASTVSGVLKGKLAYMAPEYVRGETIDRRFDVFALGVVLWESLTGKRLFRGAHEADTLDRVLSHEVPSVSTVVPALGGAFDAAIETALSKDPAHRFDNASAMAAALESSARAAGVLVSHREVAEQIKLAVGERLEERKKLIVARMANEPSVASIQFDPSRRGPAPYEPAAASETVPDLTPSVMVEKTPEPLHLVRGRDVAPSHGTLRSEPLVVLDEESIALPMKGSGAGRYGLVFVAITVAVAGAVVGIARLREDYFPRPSVSAPPVASATVAAAASPPPGSASSSSLPAPASSSAPIQTPSASASAPAPSASVAPPAPSRAKHSARPASSASPPAASPAGY